MSTSAGPRPNTRTAIVASSIRWRLISATAYAERSSARLLASDTAGFILFLSNREAMRKHLSGTASLNMNERFPYQPLPVQQLNGFQDAQHPTIQVRS